MARNTRIFRNSVLEDDRKRSQRRDEKPYVVLLLGETGSGKSTLINYLTNYFRGGSIDHPRVAVPSRYYRTTEDEKDSEIDHEDQTTSKTAECTTYRFSADNTKFSFIDTPGLSDTKGVEQDDENLQCILEAAENVGTLSAIVVIINGTVVRTTVNLRNTLTRLRGTLPDVVLENLIVVLTNCEVTRYNFDFKSLRPWKIKTENIFVMDNCALSRNPDDWRNNRRVATDMKEAWTKSMDEIQKMTNRICELDSKSTTVFRNLRQHRENLKREFHEVILEVKKLQHTQDQLENAMAAKQGAMQDVEKYRNFKSVRQVEYTVLIDASFYSTLCLTHIDKVCHEGCGLPFTQSTDAEVFWRCYCMAGTRSCRVCSCGPEFHYHAMKKLHKKSKTVEQILQDVKAQFDSSVRRANTYQTELTKLAEDLKLLQNTLQQKQAKIEGYCVDLKRICSAFNFADELNSVLDSMEANARTLTSISARQEANRMVDSIKTMADRLQMAGAKQDWGSDDEDHDRGLIQRSFRDGDEASRNCPRNERERHKDGTGYGSRDSATLGPCPQFNRSANCPAGCPYQHVCNYCEGLHSASECARRAQDLPSAYTDSSDPSKTHRSGSGHLPGYLGGQRETGIKSGRSGTHQEKLLPGFCKYFNRTGCRNGNCTFVHACGLCRGPHSIAQCERRRPSAANTVTKEQTFLPGSCRYFNFRGCQNANCKFVHSCGICRGPHSAAQCQQKPPGSNGRLFRI